MGVRWRVSELLKQQRGWTSNAHLCLATILFSIHCALFDGSNVQSLNLLGSCCIGDDSDEAIAVANVAERSDLHGSSSVSSNTSTNPFLSSMYFELSPCTVLELDLETIEHGARRRTSRHGCSPHLSHLRRVLVRKTIVPR